MGAPPPRDAHPEAAGDPTSQRAPAALLRPGMCRLRTPANLQRWAGSDVHARWWQKWRLPRCIHAFLTAGSLTASCCHQHAEIMRALPAHHSQLPACTFRSRPATGCGRRLLWRVPGTTRCAGAIPAHPWRSPTGAAHAARRQALRPPPLRLRTHPAMAEGRHRAAGAGQ